MKFYLEILVFLRETKSVLTKRTLSLSLQAYVFGWDGK